MGRENKHEDDMATKLSSNYSIYILLMFAILFTVHIKFGEPIKCLCPKNFTDHQIQYTAHFCWAQNSYHLSFDEMPNANGGSHKRHVEFYPYLPYICLLQALLFWLPGFFWHSFKDRSGIKVDNIIQDAKNIERREWLKSVLDEHFKSREFKYFVVGRNGSYLMMLFLLTKILYIANAFLQMRLMKDVFAMDFSSFNIKALFGMQDPSDLGTPPNVAFPLETMCDVKVLQRGELHPYSIQCNLPINLLAKQVYTFHWFWLIVVASVSMINFLSWLFEFIEPGKRINYVKHLLMSGPDRLDQLEDERKLRRFVLRYLGQDGVFLLRLIHCNYDNTTAAAMTKELWESWDEGNATVN